ncbi:AsmA protein [Franzmannia pantelleriensis]|uniref:AsmA protein n=1 Tax=Franzmannia pantelleriensis TaxID=48727 RepID=A0A1G9SVH6_9GAMM|nr:AsmA family protein [Halomonas pantelleriensis]SDM39442.1 AsmA protein [Halomonas pantelleriensis]
MRALLRTLLAVIGVLGLVVVGAVVYVTTFFDPNDLKPRLIDVVREQTGLELTLDGPLAWSFYPRLGVSVADAEAWLPEQSADEEVFAALDKAEVSLAFAPLLTGEIAIEGLTLNGMRLNLERDVEGQGNWEVLLERLDERSEEAAEALAPASAGPAVNDDAGMRVALNVASVTLRDSEVRYRDWQRDLQLRVTGLDITGSNVNPQRAFPLKSSFRLSAYPDAAWQESDDVEPEWVSSVRGESRVRLGLRDGRYELENLNLETSTTLAALEDRKQQANLQLRQLVASTETRRLEIDGGRLDTSLVHPAAGDRALALSLGFIADLDIDEQRLHLRSLELSGPDDLDLSGSVTLTELFEAPRYTGLVSLAPLSLRPWLARFDALPETASDAALGDVALTSPVQGDLERLNLTNLTMVVDDSTFTGRLGAGLFGQSLSFDLQGDHLDLDAYLPPAEPAAESAMLRQLLGRMAYADEDQEAALPIAWLAPLDLAGELRLERLTALGLVIRNAELAVEGREGVHQLSRFEGQLFDGSLTASGELDQREETPRWAFAPRLERVQVVPLYAALADQESPLRGRLSLDGDLTTRGETRGLMTRNLNGNVALRIDDGAVFDVNVSQELCGVVAALDGEEMSRDWSSDTRFERAEASFTLRDGMAHNDDLEISIPGIRLGGGGEFNLATQRFDYSAAARLVDSADAACRVNPRLERVPLPVRCEGQLDEDSSEWCRFDRAAFQSALGEILRDEASSRAAQEIEERLGGALEGLDERLGEGAGRELREGLRGLFN